VFRFLSYQSLHMLHSWSGSTRCDVVSSTGLLSKLPVATNLDQRHRQWLGIRKPFRFLPIVGKCRTSQTCFQVMRSTRAATTTQRDDEMKSKRSTFGFTPPCAAESHTLNRGDPKVSVGLSIVCANTLAGFLPREDARGE
jgi:hypothetical protein